MHQVEVRLVLVDVIGLKGNKFEQGLKAKDFVIYEDGREVPIDSCELVFSGKQDRKPAQNENISVPIVYRQNKVLVVFDAINTPGRDLKKAADLVIDEIVSMARNNSEVMIFFMDKLKGLRVVCAFTRQEDLLRASLKFFVGKNFPQDIDFLDYDAILSMGREQGAIPDIGPLRSIEHVNRELNRFSTSVGDLLACLHLAENLPGRKYLLFVSNGFPDIDNIRLHHDFPLDEVIKIKDPFKILSREIFNRGHSVLEEIIRIANDRRISIYSLDASTFSKEIVSGASAEVFDREGVESRKLLALARSWQIQNLLELSDKTGAVVMRGANKSGLFREIAASDFGQYYQLSYYSPKTRIKSTYHKIEVRIKDRTDILIRHRDGYSDSLFDYKR